MARRPTSMQSRDSTKPVIPEDTCPYIDMSKELVERMAEQPDLAWRQQQAELVVALLEHVRESNHALRTASKYWYDRKN